VSAVIDAQSIPLSAATATLRARGTVGIEAIVSGGDDYEILCAIPENHFEAFAQAARAAGVAVTSIGTIMSGASVPRLLDGQGREIELRRRSYSHF
jgi:thiamine-monophosphate kinase